MGIFILIKSIITNGQQFIGKPDELVKNERYRFVDAEERKYQFNNNYRIITNSNTHVVPKFYRHVEAKVPVRNNHIVYRKVNPIFVNNNNLKLSGSSPLSSKVPIFPLLPLEKDKESISHYFGVIDSYGNSIKHPYQKAPFVPINNQENINNNNFIHGLESHNYEFDNNHLDIPFKNSAATVTNNNLPSPNFYLLPGGVFTDLTESDELVDPISLNQQHNINILDEAEPIAPDKFTPNELINETTGLSDENQWKPITKAKGFEIYNPKKRKKRSYEVVEKIDEDTPPSITYNYNAYKEKNKSGSHLRTFQNYLKYK